MSFCASAAEAGEQQCRSADHADRQFRRRRQQEQRMRAGHEVDAGGHHRRRVDQRAHRRRAGHRIGQPGLQRQLRRFADRTAEQEEGGQRGDRGTHRPALRGVLHGTRDVERAEPARDHQQADQQRGVADARHDEGLARGEAVGRVAPPKADQQIGAKPDALPAGVEGEEITRQHQQEHGRDEEIEMGEEPAIALLAFHELGREQMDEEADAGDDQHHHQGQRIEAQADLRREPADIEPVPQGLLVDRARRRIEQETSRRLRRQ